MSKKNTEKISMSQEKEKDKALGENGLIEDRIR